MRALWTTFLLNTVFTVVQFFFARMANSLALMGDTGTMFVDSATYLVNLAAEYYKDRLGPRNSKVVEVSATFFSAVSLLGVTVYIMTDAVERLTHRTGQDVDEGIMLIFTSINLLVDFGMCGSIVLRRTGGLIGCLGRRFYCCGEAASSGAGASSDSVSSSDSGGAGGTCCWCAGGGDGDAGVAGGDSDGGGRSGNNGGGGGGGGGSGGEATGAAPGSTAPIPSGVAAQFDISTKQELNLCSAFAHVLADTMRTLTVMSCALLVSLGNTDPEMTDAIGSLAVCAIILGIAAYLFYEGAVQIRAYRVAAPADDPSLLSRYPPTASGTVSSPSVHVSVDSAADSAGNSAAPASPRSKPGASDDPAYLEVERRPI